MSENFLSLLLDVRQGTNRHTWNRHHLGACA
jgi:hypothetical protein